MRKILFVFAFALVGTAMNAQTKACSKSAAKTCTKAEMEACKKAGITCLIMEDGSTTDVASALKSAELAASNDENIEKRTCEKSGAISFYQKKVCAVSGKVSKSEVAYDVKAGEFVNVSPRDIMSAEKEAKVVKTAGETTTKKSL